MQVKEMTEYVFNENFKQGPFEITVTLESGKSDLFIRTKEGSTLLVEGSLIEFEDLAEMIKQAVSHTCRKVTVHA